MGTTAPLNHQELLEQTILRQTHGILTDPSYVLSSEYVLLNLGQRSRVFLGKHNWCKHSFLPLSVKIIIENRA